MRHDDGGRRQGRRAGGPADARAAQQAAAGAGLKIVVIEGEAAVSVIRQKTAVAPVVEVRDRNDQPMAGAPRRGDGVDADRKRALQIGALAAFQGQTAAVLIVQTDVMTAALSSQAVLARRSIPAR